MLYREVESVVGLKQERIEVLHLADTESGRLTQDAAKSASIEEPLQVFAGVATIMSGVPGPNGQPVAAIPNELRFPINASNLQEAFERYPEELQAFIEKLKQAQQEEAQKAAQAQSQEVYVPTAEESDAINNLKFKSEG